MSTGTFIVQSALEEIGVHSIASPAAPESIDKGFKALNSMMQLWVSRGIDLDIVPLKSVGDDLNEPPDTTNAIIDNLALQLAPKFSNGQVVVSPDLRANANKGLGLVRTLYQTFEVPKKVPSSTLPMGAGNSKGIWRRTFWGTKKGGLDG